MGKRKWVALLLLSALAAAVMTVVRTLRAQQSPQQSARQQSQNRKFDEYLDKFPAADYDAPEDPDPESRAKRRDKSSKYNRPKINKLDPSAPVVAAMSNDWEWGLESTLPAKQSSAVVVGTVSDARAFVSEDKTNIYSEYSVRVDAVLKNFDDRAVKAGDTLVAERQGGRARMRSGDVSAFSVSGQNPPQVGSRYVFFLGYNKYDVSNISTTAAEMSHYILTAYELRGGKVAALDNPGGMYFKEHDGKDEAAFLGEIRRLLAEPSRTPNR